MSRQVEALVPRRGKVAKVTRECSREKERDIERERVRERGVMGDRCRGRGGKNNNNYKGGCGGGGNGRIDEYRDNTAMGATIKILLSKAV
jgi:hypothetical protein